MRKRALLLTAVWLSAGWAVSWGQQANNEAPPLYRNTVVHYGGVSVPPVPGVPFSATAMIENQRPLADGSVETSRNVNLVGRDSQGRTHGELRTGDSSTVGMPKLVEVHIFDPQTRMDIYYELATHIARRQVLPESHRSTGASNPQVTTQDLGTTTLENFVVSGTRRTLIVPPQVTGTGTPLTVVDEYWYSEDLHLNLLVRHDDPRTGLQTIAYTNIKREEPPPSFFEVPAGYTVVDIAPPSGGLAGRGSAAKSTSTP